MKEYHTFRLVNAHQTLCILGMPSKNMQDDQSPWQTAFLNGIPPKKITMSHKKRTKKVKEYLEMENMISQISSRR